MKRQIGGILPALVTPFKGDGSLNTETAGRLVETLLGEGVHGFYVAGSTGECFLMDTAERKKLLEAVLEANRGRGLVIAHIGAMATRDAVELARHAADRGVDAVSAVPPFYFRYRVDELVGYYRDIVDHVAAPLMIYNIPILSGVSIGLDNAAELMADPRIAGIKWSSSDFYQMERIKSRFPRLAVMNGFDEMCLAGLATGASGAIGSTYNFMGKRFVRIRELVAAGRVEEARPLQAQANEIIAALLEIGPNAAVKAILRRRGIDVGQCRPPFRPLDPDRERALLDTVDRVEAGAGQADGTKR